MVRLPPGGRALAAAIPAVGVAVVVLAIVGPTVMPGVGYWDTGEFQTIPPILGTMHPTGYPTYVILGFLVNVLLTPIGEPAYRMNVLSLLSVVAAAGLTADLIRRLTGRAAIAVASGIGLALTPVTWAIAVRADAHALHLAFVALLLWLLVRWEGARRADEPRADRLLIVAAAIFGLSAGNHSLTLLLALPIGLFVLAVEPRVLRRGRLILTCVAALVGSLAVVYLELPLRAGPFRAPLVYADPSTWDGFWYIALAEQFRGALSNPVGDLPQKLGVVADFAGRQLGPLVYAVPLGLVATVVRAPRLALLTGTAVLITILFNASYSNADIERYYLGPGLMAWLWLGLLMATIVDLVAPAEPDAAAEDVAAEGDAEAPVNPASDARAGGVRRLPRLVGAGLSAALAIALLVPTAIAFPVRMGHADHSSDTAAGRWLDAALDQIEPDAVVVSWWSYSTPLWYAQYVEGRRRDILVVDDRTRIDLGFGDVPDVIERFLGQRPVYVMRVNGTELGPILRRYDLEPLTGTTAGNVYRVVGPREPAG